MSRDDHNEGARVAAEGRDPEWNKPWPRPSESSEEYQQRVEDFERGYFQTVGQRDGAEGRTLKSESTYRLLDLDHNQMRDDAYQSGRANGGRHRPSEGDTEAGSSSVFDDASDDEPQEEEIDSSLGFSRDYLVSTVTHSKPKSDPSESSAKFAYGALAFLGLMIVLGATAEPKRDSGKEEDFGSRVACAVMVFGVLLFIALVAACFLK